MIQVENLTKWYGPTCAVNDISFHIPRGKIVGFLGPNGAGKSTTLRIMTGYLPPTAGRVTIDGHDVLHQSDLARGKIGYLPENTPLYQEMRVEEYLQYRGRLYGMDRASRRSRINLVCDRCGLSAVRRRLVGELSRGNRQRVGLGQALLHDPAVLILDEPTASLDPNQIGEVRKLIGELRGQHTIIISTHVLPEVEKTADDVMIIAGGRIVAQGSPDELRRNVAQGASVVVEVKANPESVERALRAVEGVAQIETTSNDGWTRAVVNQHAGQDAREGLGLAMSNNGWTIREMRHVTASLEQFFIEITAQQDQEVPLDRAAMSRPPEPVYREKVAV